MTGPIQDLVARLRRRTHATRDRLLRIFIVVLVVRTAQEMSDDDGTHMAAGVAYYAIFSIFPLLLGLIALFSIFVEPEDIQSRLTDFAADYLPGSEELVSSNIEIRGALGIVAIFVLLWSGSAIFGALARAVNRAWDVHRDRPLYISKPRQLVMALVVGLLFWLSISAAAFSRIAGRFDQSDLAGFGFLVNAGGRVMLQGTSFFMTLGIFLLIYKFTPNTKTYWRYIWPGALLGAVLFELSKNLFIFYLDRFATFETTYGALAPVLVLLLWTYVSSLILILGAELSSEYGRLKQGVDRGVLLHPHDPD